MKPSGNGHNYSLHFTHPPQRVVSLVPSLSESLFDLGLGHAVVGVSDYCIHPAHTLQHLPRVGGVKNPRLQDILGLQPDLVLANWEENTRSAVEALRAAGVPVWVTFPKTVLESIDILRKLTELFRSHEAEMRVRMLEKSLEWTIAAVDESQTKRLFCPIWADQTGDGIRWWMSFDRRTYCSDLLYLLGGDNICANRPRRYPLAADLGLAPQKDAGDRDTRYPRLPLAEIIAAQPEIILLPSEPFSFDESHRSELQLFLAETPAARDGRIHLVDGTLITWAGTRLARALIELPPLMM